MHKKDLQGMTQMTPQQSQEKSYLEETGHIPFKGHALFYRIWRPKNRQDIKGVIHINHGMSEHSARYEHFALLCVERGFLVIAQDHPGHGKSAELMDLGHISDLNSWKTLIKGIKATQDLVHQQYGNLPTLLFGHSMGSFATLSFLEQNLIDALQKNGLPIIGVVLSGSTQNPWYLNKSLQVVAALERWRQGRKGKSRIINLLTFESFNKRFAPTRTKADWLTRDAAAVDEYMQDPLCGAQSTNQTWYEFAKGLLQIFSRKNLKKLPKHVPFLLISGDQDPLSDEGGFHRLEQTLRSSGIQNLQAKTFPHGRHELLNEINHEEVETTLFEWIDSTAWSKHLEQLKVS